MRGRIDRLQVLLEIAPRVCRFSLGIRPISYGKARPDTARGILDPPPGADWDMKFFTDIAAFTSVI